MAITLNVQIAIDEARTAIEEARASDSADPATIAALDSLLKVTAALRSVVAQS
ncbi:hypothetical protein [Arthrobacter sp. ov118]|uniref:hypothetical protein n=1 Tax=Arthrobacter sp. ov118 TaxID=1761747 RepID=UPI0015A4F7BA|nr:hypothetical protein [Arthrobacter sp. ov118]